MKIYLNKWFDRTAKEYFFEQYVFPQIIKEDTLFEKAIEELELLNGGRHFSYIETIFIDTKAGTSKVINLEEEVKARRSEEQIKNDGEESRHNNLRKEC